MSFMDAGPIDDESPRLRECARCHHLAVHHESNHGVGPCWWGARCPCTQFDPIPQFAPIPTMTPEEAAEWWDSFPLSAPP